MSHEDWQPKPRRPFAVAVGRAILRARMKAGVTRQELARRIGYSHHTVKNWESGIRAGDHELDHIAEVLGVEIEPVERDP